MKELKSLLVQLVVGIPDAVGMSVELLLESLAEGYLYHSVHDAV